MVHVEDWQPGMPPPDGYRVIPAGTPVAVGTAPHDELRQLDVRQSTAASVPAEPPQPRVLFDMRRTPPGV